MNKDEIMDTQLPTTTENLDSLDGQTGTPDQKVSYETYQKVLSEAKNAKKRLKDIEDAEKVRTETELSERGEYKKLLSQRDEELNKLRVQMAENQKRETDRRKLASVLDGIGADIDPKFYGLIDYEIVGVDPETGAIDELSRAKAIEKFKIKYPEIIPNVNAPRLPNQAPVGDVKLRISRSEWLKLPSSEMKKWKPAQIED